MIEPYTVALTSCARFDLLERTLTSLLPRLEGPCERIIIGEDSGDGGGVLEVIERFRSDAPPIHVLLNRRRLGICRNIDRIYAEVKNGVDFPLRGRLGILPRWFHSRVLRGDAGCQHLLRQSPGHFRISIGVLVARGRQSLHRDRCRSRPLRWSALQPRLAPDERLSNRRALWAACCKRPGGRRIAGLPVRREADGVAEATRRPTHRMGAPCQQAAHPFRQNIPERTQAAFVAGDWPANPGASVTVPPKVKVRRHRPVRKKANARPMENGSGNLLGFRPPSVCGEHEA